MATKRGFLKLLFAAIWLFPLLVTTNLYAQSSSLGTLQECIDNFNAELAYYLSDIEATKSDVQCYSSQGYATATRWGRDGVNPPPAYVSISAWAADKQCYVQNQNGAYLGDVFDLSGHDFAQWKKYVLGSGCELLDEGAKRIFVTSQTFTGDLISEAKALGIHGKIRSGLQAADKICTKLANDAGLPGDTYTAWLSDSTTHARDRVVHSEVPYVLANAAQVASNYDSLIDRLSPDFCATGTCLDHVIDTDELQGTHGSDKVWTATSYVGTFDTPACQDWTATTGYGSTGVTYFRNQYWTQGGGDEACSGTFRLFCLQD